MCQFTFPGFLKSFHAFSFDRSLRQTLPLVCLLGLLMPGEPGATTSTEAILDFSLEELGNIEVTSVSKRTQQARSAAASVFVITREDMRLAGVRTLPEALRLAPNLQVAQITSSQYAISARGFNSSTANKLLVLIDGRVVYTPLYSGVFWDDQFVFLPDIERIEVLSGPGGTLWGANAVNGVINITMRAAADSLGNLAYAQTGDSQYGGGIRHGGRLAADWNYRLYSQHQGQRGLQRADGSDSNDDWQHSLLGFRADQQTDFARSVLDATIGRGRIDLSSLPNRSQRNDSAHVLVRHERTMGNRELQLQAYFDYIYRDVPSSYRQRLQTLDLEVQQRHQWGENQAMTYGAGYRIAADDVDTGPTFSFKPDQRSLTWVNVFAHYERPLSERLVGSAGARLEYNPYSGWDALPSARLSWQVNADHFVWLALSRAVRAPSRIDTDFSYPAMPPFLLTSDDSFRSEIVNALDIGYRGSVGTLQFSVTAFATDYQRLRSLDSQPDGSVHLGNALKAKTHGVELWGNWVISPRWRIDGGGIYLHQDFRLGGLVAAPEGRDPSSRWYLRSHWRWAMSEELNLWFRSVNDLKGYADSGYTSLNLRYAHHFGDDIELALSGFNLLDPGHPEFASGSPQLNPIEAQRSVQISVTVVF